MFLQLAEKPAQELPSVPRGQAVLPFTPAAVGVLIHLGQQLPVLIPPFENLATIDEIPDGRAVLVGEEVSYKFGRFAEGSINEASAAFLQEVKGRLQLRVVHA